MKKIRCRPVNKIWSSSVVLFDIALLVILFIYGCATPSILATREQNSGDNFFNQHNYTEAIKHYNLMIDASRKLGIYRNLSMESDVQRKISNCYEMAGRYDQAISHIHMAMMLDSADNNILGRIEDYRQEGKIYVYMGSYQKGIASLEKSLSLSEGMDQSLKNVQRLSIADTYLALGQLYAVMGRLTESQEYINKALPIFKQATDRKGEMESYLTMGSIFSDLGELITAQNLIRQSLKIANELEMGTARHNQLLSSISVSLGEYEDAVRFQEVALKEAGKYGITGQIIWATIGMGDIYRDLGDFNRAEKYYRQAGESKDTLSVEAANLKASLDLRLGDVLDANEYFKAEGSIAGEGISSLRFAEMLIQSEKNDSALLFLNQSNHVFLEARNRQGLANVKLLRGSILVDKGDFITARELLDSATLTPEFPETVWQAYYHLGRMYESLNQNDKAIESYMNSVSVIEKIRGNMTLDAFKSIYFDSKRDVYDRLINILLKNNKPIDAFQYSEKARARAFYDILANKKIDFRGSAPGDLISMEQDKRIEIQKLYMLLQRGDAASVDNEGSRNSDTKQIRNTLMQAQNEYEELLQKIKLNNPSYGELITAQPVSFSDLQARIDPKTAVLSYWIRNKELVLWLITHSGVISKTVSIDKNDLTTIIEKTRRAIQSNSNVTATSGLSDLYQLLVAPVEDNLAPFSNLVIIPNGPIHFLPFQALINMKGDYLVQHFNMIYAPSASIYTICNDRLIKTGSRFMGMALSDVIVGNNVGLPGTEDELKKILPLFPDNISAIGKESTETFVKKNAGNYNFIHFATHGSYNYRQPLYSYLLFSSTEEDDGRLNVSEVLEMNINAKLVTLSACETGLGNLDQGDELTGLSRAFIFAGSSAVIVSLWSVADYPTSLLMTNFYRYLKEYPMQVALSMAQRDVLKVFPQPLYWSPFILIGNGNIRAI